ncbi:hypothetical protein MPSEU_000223400 [Mayamaea pseudoterrestris]|nr:hypothetical protein MPSEU_000223400 [Mayamaea pseudoterrestris]
MTRRTSFARSPCTADDEPPILMLAPKRLNDYYSNRIQSRRRSIFGTLDGIPTTNQHSQTQLCASLTNWNVDKLRQRSESSSFQLSHEEQVDISFQMRRQRMEQYFSKMQQADGSTISNKKTSSSSSSKRQDLAIVIDQESGLPQAMPDQNRAKATVPTAASSRSKSQRRVSISGGGISSHNMHHINDNTAYSPVALRRHSSLTKLEDKLKLLPGQSPPRQKQTRRGSNAFTNQMTQQLELTILNADLPQHETKRLLRRSSMGGSSMHSASMDSSAHSHNAHAGIHDDHEYDASSRPMEMDAAMRRMRRTSIENGCIMAQSSESTTAADPYGYGDAAPNIRVLHATHVGASNNNHVDSTTGRMRRSSVGGAMPTSASDPYGYGGDTFANGHSLHQQSASPDFEATQAMRRMRRSSIGGVMPSSSNGLPPHGYVNCPNVRWLSHSADSLPVEGAAAISEPLSKEDFDTNLTYCSPARKNLSLLSRLLGQDKKGKKSKKKCSAKDPAVSLRCLEQLALDMSGPASPVSPKRQSPRRDVPPAIDIVKCDPSGMAADRSPTKVLPSKRVALGA